jgi:phosphate transport system protein
MSEHTAKQFDSELDDLRAQVTRMGGLVEEQLQAALTAFVETDRDALDKVIARDKEVDHLEIEIDSACTGVIARRQPAAGDLRLVLGITKVVTDIERIGDEAKKIAKTTRNLLERGATQMLEAAQVRHMGSITQSMLHHALDAFVHADTAAAARLVRRDKEVDRAFRAIVRQMVTYMMEDPRTITTALDIIFIAKSVERIGDHCKNIAEDVIYIDKGHDVRHLGLKEFERKTEKL